MHERLPISECTRVDATKVVDYLLNPAKSRGKAEFFLRFGFTAGDWTVFASALISHGRSGLVTSVVESAYGIRYCVDGPLVTPSGRRPQVRSVWIIENGAIAPRLITAHPL